VNRKAQARLKKKLIDIRDRLEMFVKAGSFIEGIEKKLESPRK
jgi:hypothetical protein